MSLLVPFLTPTLVHAAQAVLDRVQRQTLQNAGADEFGARPTGVACFCPGLLANEADGPGWGGASWAEGRAHDGRCRAPSEGATRVSAPPWAPRRIHAALGRSPRAARGLSIVLTRSSGGLGGPPSFTIGCGCLAREDLGRAEARGPLVLAPLLDSLASGSGLGKGQMESALTGSLQI